jgi:phosphoribosylformylglycinamidine synthase
LQRDWLTNKVTPLCRWKSSQTANCRIFNTIEQLRCNGLRLQRKKEEAATSMGHSPVAALIDPIAGVERRLPRRYQIVWAPIKDGLDGISLSANWMWACKTGEDARLYAAVESCSNFAIELE